MGQRLATSPASCRSSATGASTRRCRRAAGCPAHRWGRMGTGSHQPGAAGLHGSKAGHQPGKLPQLGNRRQHQALQARSGLPGPSVGHMGTGSHQPGAAGLHGRRRPQAGAAERVAARPIGGAHGHRIASAWGSRPAWAKGWPPARQAAAARQPAPEGGAPEEIPSRPFPGKLATVRDAVNQRRARRIVQITGNLRKVILIYVNDYFNSHNVKVSPFCPHFVPVLSPQPFPCKPS